MKLNDTLVLAALCGFIGAAGAIVQNYSLARTASRGPTPVSSANKYSWEMKRQFLKDQCPLGMREECAYMALYEQAQAANNVQEMTALRTAHLRHYAASSKHPSARKSRVHLQKSLAPSTHAEKSAAPKQAPAAHQQITPDRGIDAISVNGVYLATVCVRPYLLPYMDDIFHVRQQRIF